MRMDDITDFVTAETDQESCSRTDLESEKESDDSEFGGCFFPKNYLFSRATCFSIHFRKKKNLYFCLLYNLVEIYSNSLQVKFDFHNKMFSSSFIHCCH